MIMSLEHIKYLQREVKDFINLTHSLIDKAEIGEEFVNNAEFVKFAEKIWSLHHFSKELLLKSNFDESTMYNARIIQDLTETPIYSSGIEKNSCSLIRAADRLKLEGDATPIKSIMHNLIEDSLSSEVLFDDLMVIYKDLAA